MTASLTRSRAFLFLLAGCVLGGPTIAQDAARTPLTLKEAVLEAHSTYAPERLSALAWVPGTSSYAWVQDSLLMLGGPGKVADRSVTSLAAINAGLPDSLRMKRFPRFEWDDDRHLHFWQRGILFGVDTETGKVERLLRVSPDAANEDLHAASRHVAYTVDQDLYIALPGDRQVQVTKDGGNGIVNGQAVHRQEYGITKGTFWSPDGSRLAFHRMDESMVTPYRLEDIGSSPSTFDEIRYPMAGQTSHQVTIGVHDLKAGTTVFLQTGEPADQYLTNIAWGPDGERLYVVHLDRATENLRLVEYDVRTGRALRELMTERSAVYLEPEHPMQFLPEKPTQYLWWSDRDGWDHLYLYDLKKGLVRQLTQGSWSVTEVLGFDEKGGTLFVEGTGEVLKDDPHGAMERHVYAVDLASGDRSKLTAQPGSHSGTLSPDGSMLIDTWSSLTVPGRTELIGREGELMKVLQESPDPLAGRTTGSIELLTIAGEGGDRLNARLIKPSDFDPGRKYPVLVYLYNGPHVQLVRNAHLGGAALWMLHAAERGYLVFTVDGHGSAGRSRDFEQTIHRRLGTVEVADQLRGVEYLKSLPYVDGDRLAVHGWSFGGFMTTSLMVKAPGTFKVGVAGGPVMDWRLYEVMYTERYMDTPEENPEGYATAALPDKCTALEGELLLIHGLQDDVVLPEHSYRFLKACVDQGEQLEFFVYPGHPHNVRGKDRLHLMTQVLDRIDRSIKP